MGDFVVCGEEEEGAGEECCRVVCGGEVKGQWWVDEEEVLNTRRKSAGYEEEEEEDSLKSRPDKKRALRRAACVSMCALHWCGRARSVGGLQQHEFLLASLLREVILRCPHTPRLIMRTKMLSFLPLHSHLHAPAYADERAKKAKKNPTRPTSLGSGGRVPWRHAFPRSLPVSAPRARSAILAEPCWAGGGALAVSAPEGQEEGQVGRPGR